MAHYAVSVIGRDRPGIVAGVAAALLEQGANIEDSQSTILRGHFTMTLIVEAGGKGEESALRTGLERAARALGLEALTISDVGGSEPSRPSEPSHIVTAYGADHPGIVNAVAAALAGADVNITDLNTRLVGEPEQDDLYAMMLEVALPAGMDAADLDALLEATRREQGVEVTVRPLEPDVL